MERIKKIVRFYINGFKNMTWGKELWILIIIKLVIMFWYSAIIFLPSCGAFHCHVKFLGNRFLKCLL